jgi:hypothetical protein
MNNPTAIVFEDAEIMKIRNVEALGVYGWLMLAFQDHKGVKNKKEAARLLVHHFDMKETKAEKLIDYLIKAQVKLPFSL